MIKIYVFTTISWWVKKPTGPGSANAGRQESNYMLKEMEIPIAPYPGLGLVTIDEQDPYEIKQVFINTEGEVIVQTEGGGLCSTKEDADELVEYFKEFGFQHVKGQNPIFRATIKMAEVKR